MGKRKVKKFLRAIVASIAIPLTRITGRRKKNNVCIFHNGRCGSTVIGNLLGKHKDIYWDGQIYAKLFLKTDGKTFSRKTYEKELAVTILNNKMKDVYSKYYGFDVKRNHISWLNYSITDYLKQLTEMGFDQFIVLERHNHLRVILSYTIAREAGIWHIHRHQQALEKPIHINPAKVYLEYEEKELVTALDEMATYFDEVRTAFNHLNLPYLNLSYENDIREDPRLAYRKIVSHMGLKIGHPKTRFNRTNPFPVSKMVANYDELCEYLSDTPYAWMLEE